MVDTKKITYDLTGKITPNLDKHMMFPLLDFLIEKQVYKSADLLKAKVEVASKTSMVDFWISLYQELNNTKDIPQEMSDKRESVLAEIQKTTDSTTELLKVFADPDFLKNLRQDKMFNLQYIQSHYSWFTPESLNNLYNYAMQRYAIGDYETTTRILYHFRLLSTDQEKNTNAMWGKLAAEILQSNYETALEDLIALRQYIDREVSQNPLLSLQQRTWLLHWGLFIFFKVPKGKETLIEMFLSAPYKQAIQITSPYLLRYLAVTIIVHRRRQSELKELVSMIQQEENYSDPITDFVESLFVRFDFDAAQQKLRDCEMVLTNDYFLADLLKDFTENARMFIFETYCKIHQRIDIRMIAEKLNMGVEEAERWIVNLIRNAKLDAKIDSEANSVIMTQYTKNVYQQVIEKTKALTLRTHMLINNIDKRESQTAFRQSKYQQQQQQQQQQQASKN